MEISRATNACTRTTHKLELNVLEITEKFRIAFNQISLSVPNLEESVVPYQHAGLVTTRKVISSRPDITRRVVKSIVEGAALVQNEPSVAKRALSARLHIKNERELEETYQLLRGFTRPKPYPSLGGFREILSSLIKRMPSAKAADPRDFSEPRFIEELDQNGYIDSLYK